MITEEQLLRIENIINTNKNDSDLSSICVILTYLVNEIRELRTYKEAIGVFEKTIIGTFGYSLQGGGHRPCTYFAASLLPEQVVSAPNLIDLANELKKGLE
jgi:hypothetical protein